MLLGRPPYCGRNVAETLTRAQEPEPPAPPGVPRDLETICMACLRKDPAGRYLDADALAADLRAFLAGEPVEARPPGLRDRAAGWARLHPVVLVWLGAAAVAATPGPAAGAARVDALATVAAAAMVLAGAGSWYGLRLRRAVAELGQQRAASERQVERMHLLLELTRRVMAVDDADELLRRIGETATQLADAARSTIFL